MKAVAASCLFHAFIETGGNCIGRWVRRTVSAASDSAVASKHAKDRAQPSAARRKTHEISEQMVSGCKSLLARVVGGLKLRGARTSPSPESARWQGTSGTPRTPEEVQQYFTEVWASQQTQKQAPEVESRVQSVWKRVKSRVASTAEAGTRTRVAAGGQRGDSGASAVSLPRRLAQTFRLNVVEKAGMMRRGGGRTDRIKGNIVPRYEERVPLPPGQVGGSSGSAGGKGGTHGV